MWETILIGLGLAVARNVGQWLKGAFVDKKVDKYEWTQLATSSVVTIAVYGVGLIPGAMANFGNEEALSAILTLLVAPAINKWVDGKLFKKKANRPKKAAVSTA